MKTTLLSFCLILFCSGFVSAQDTTWINSRRYECHRDEAKYYQLESTEGDLTSFTRYYISNNQVWNTGQYLAGKKQGRFLFFYENGQKATEFVCINGKIEGQFTSWHENGAVNEKGFYKDGWPSGNWIEYDEDGNLLRDENLEEEVDWGVVEENGQQENDSESDDPTWTYAPEKYPEVTNLDEVTKAIGYPKKARRKKLEGKVVVRVLVCESGEYEKHLVLREIDPILNEAVEKQLPNLRFTPGIQEGKPVRMWMTIPFEFSLEDQIK